jgi:hypothetical protein
LYTTPSCPLNIKSFLLVTNWSIPLCLPLFIWSSMSTNSLFITFQTFFSQDQFQPSHWTWITFQPSHWTWIARQLLAHWCLVPSQLNWDRTIKHFFRRLALNLRIYSLTYIFLHTCLHSVSKLFLRHIIEKYLSLKETWLISSIKLAGIRIYIDMYQCMFCLAKIRFYLTLD